MSVHIYFEIPARSAKAGYEAVQYLLNGATKIPSQEICCRDFHKKGSYFLAKADFYKVMPTDVNKFQLPNGVGIFSFALRQFINPL